MKNTLKLFAIAILFGLCPPLYSQQYHPLVNPGAVWFETYTNYTPSPFGYNTCGRKYFEGDTVINNLSFKKIYHERLDVFCTDIVLDGPDYAGAIREDTIQQKVWYISPNHVDEILYFDFSLSAGDSVSWDTYFGLGFNWIYEVISDVDTIVTLDGVERRKWIFDADPYSDESFVIEGLGCSSGLLAPYEVLFEYANYLANFHIDTTLIYCSDFIGCDLPTDTCTTVGIVSNLNDAPLLVFPNPVVVGKPIRIDNIPFLNDENVVIEIFNMIGEKTASFTENKSQFVTIPAPEKSGIYFLLLSNSNLKKTIKLYVK
ncbi:MAG: hypothetical protein B6D61_09110 [Bacteroidetes bacterium 4484_249]|nr:MAG: hypothetical protein B6D61_09110 [Bacteroidetes bacterium 4484_249]